MVLVDGGLRAGKIYNMFIAKLGSNFDDMEERKDEREKSLAPS